jgi:quinoprotein glucose dehydrogenase
MLIRPGTAMLMAAMLVSLSGINRATAQDWPVYGGDRAGTRFSGLTQIDRGNVANLKEVWRFETNEAGESQTNPLVVGRTLYAYTPGLKVIALDAASGKLLWKFDAGVRTSGPHRGLTYWTDGKESRLFAGVMNVLYALDPATGMPIGTFGDDGGVDLRQGLGGDAETHFVSLTTPGIIYQDLIVVGFRTTEAAPAPAGDIRAYDVRTGQLRWSFHTIPHPGETGHESWPKDAWKSAGAANSWSGFALDEQRGIVYAPTASPVSDFYGADRRGDNLYANSLIALSAATGQRLWHFQAVHHDIWDRDFPSPPVLVTLNRNGKRVAAVAQTSKQGFVYVFNRVTGKSLFPIRERKVPASKVPGERAAATQPFPLTPAPFARQLLTEDILTTRTPAAHAWALEQFRSFISAGQFVPLSAGKSTVVFPGFDGGAEWGGAAVDPQSGVLYVNANDVAWTGSLIESVPGGGFVANLYQAQCATCHGADRKGSPPAFPSLVDIGQRLSAAQINEVIRAGKGRMAPLTGLPGFAATMIGDFIRNNGVATPPPALVPGANPRREMAASMFAEGKPTRYRFSGYNKFLDKDGYPAVATPWGTLNAIDLNTGKYLWKIPFGSYPELVAKGMTDTGSENYGGPVITATGLLFIGATIFDRKLRAFDRSNGQLLWEHELPFAGTATPATYAIDGRQYVVIATSNARNAKAPQGGAYVAFALPTGRP